MQGDAWQVHGGGFYHMVKYLVAPARMPDELTWFKWEAYTTWLSGFALLVIVYYLGAELYLIDKSVLDLTRADGGGRRASEACCWPGCSTRRCAALRSAGTRLRWRSWATSFWSALTYAFTHVFSGRGAFTQIGALIGTIMVANVFVIVIPNQKKTVAALLAGKAPDPRWGEEAKQRSVHNNYLTLPVVFLMIANHYPLMFATRFNWLIVAIVLAIGPVIRHFFNSRHEGKGSPWWTWGVAAAGMIAVAWLSGAGPARRQPRACEKVDVKAAENTVLSRCSMCHRDEPLWPGVHAPPKGVVLDDPESIRRHARLIEINAVRSHAMPPGNITEMTREERQILAAWIAAGAPAR